MTKSIVLYIKGYCPGGGSDLAELEAAGGLDPLLSPFLAQAA